VLLIVEKPAKAYLRNIDPSDSAVHRSSMADRKVGCVRLDVGNLLENVERLAGGLESL